MMPRTGGEAPPRIPFDAALFRGLDARAHREIEAASSIVQRPAGAVLYEDGDRGETLSVLLSGEVELTRTRRAGGARELVRRVGPGEVFGEEVTVLAQRQATARAISAVSVAEIPVHLFRRVAVRSGRAELADKLERTLRRSVARDLLATMQLARDLDQDSLDALLDAVSFQTVERGRPVYRQGEPSSAMFVVADGMVQLQTDEDERIRVRAYLVRGDFFGDEELETATPRLASAVASGPSTVLVVAARVVRQIAARDPELFSRLRKVALGAMERQRGVIGEAAAGATQHAFRDLYRLQVARSLLVIDLESCVRCGQCAWACADLHGGTSRLVRRGDKVVSRLARLDDTFDVFRSDPQALGGGAPRVAAAKPRSLLLPSSCQHCENPSCMIDCPTGAIGKDPSGEVFIREELCTGCGACARACPWDNIQMAARPTAAPRPPGIAADEVAVKCDLCRTYERGPACVQVCPTASILRVDPKEDLGELAALFGSEPQAGPAPARTSLASTSPLPVIAGAAVGAAGLALAGAVMRARGALDPGRGLGFAAGVGAGVLFLALLAYALPKRAVRAWMRLPPQAGGVRSVTRPQYAWHLGIGVVCLAAAFAHVPSLALRATAGSALFAALVVAGASGLLLALLYAVIPRALSRIERTALLPEDFRAEREALESRLFRSLTGKGELVKAVCDKVVLPYVRRPLGWVALLASRRDLRHEQRALRARIDRRLEGRGNDRLGGLDEICRVAVEIRALPAQRVLLYALRAPLPIHVASFAVALALLAIHVVRALGGPS